MFSKNTLHKIFNKEAITNFFTGQLTKAQLASMGDDEIEAFVNFDNRGGRFDTQYVRERARRMSDVDLMAQINYDAEEGRINTPYSAEYQHRKFTKITC